MKKFSDLFADEVRDLYSAETQLIKALPEMAHGAKNPKLKEVFREHLEETKKQAQRLEKIASFFHIDLKGAGCEAMEGLIREGKKTLKTDYEHDVKDAAIIGNAQRIEHYEIAGYGTLKTFANHLGLSEAKELLDETLQEEGCADKKLTKLAEGTIFTTGINAKACCH